MNKILLYPVAYGVCGLQNNKKINVLITKNGKTEIIQTKTKKLNKLINVFLIRGLIFFAVGIYETILGLFEFNEMYKKSEQTFLGKTKNSLNISAKSIVVFIVAFAGVVLSYFLLGLIPIKLSFYLAPKNFDVFLKRLIIALIKFAIIYISFLIIKYLKFFSQYYKFNSAIKEKQQENGQINFLTYLISSIFFAGFVLSFIGLPTVYWFSVIINPAIALVCFVLNYEIFKELEKNKRFKWINNFFYFLIDEKPSQKEIKCVNIILKELELTGFNKQKMEKTNNEISFSESYVNAKEKLEKANKFEKSDLDFIFCEVLNKNRAELKLTRFISKESNKKVQDAVERRAKGEPITKIFGYANFYGFDFNVTKDVLSPRMDTEILVEQVLKECTSKTKVLDIGTGSGAIAITVAKLGGAKVTAVDISDKALAVASQNAEANGVKVVFKKSDIFLGLSSRARFDIIVSNPPYIPNKDIENLDEEVKNFDPVLALAGGENGLDFYEKIIDEAPNKLEKNGKLFFEVGINQAKDVKKLLQKNFKDIRIVKDLNKIDRVVIATLA